MSGGCPGGAPRALCPRGERNVGAMNAPAPGSTEPPVTRPAALVAAVRRESITRLGTNGAVGQAWQWALAGTCPSPVTGRPAPGSPPPHAELIAEAKTADGQTFPASQRIYDTDPQIAAARRVLEWLASNTDEIPLPAGGRGRFVGARDDYARPDQVIREVLSWAQFGLGAGDLPAPMDPLFATRPWQWNASWMDAAWLRGTRDMLAWVAGDRDTAPLSGEIAHLPPLADAMIEYGLAYDVLEQGRPGGQPVQPATYPPPQYGEAVQATCDWLSGALTSPPADRHGHGAYSGCRERDVPCRCTVTGGCAGDDCAACAFSRCALGQAAV